MRMKSFELLKLARESAGLSLSQAVDLTGISKLRLAILETQETRPQHAERQILADVYGVTYDYLLTGKPASLCDVLALYRNATSLVTAKAIETWMNQEARA